MSAIEQPVVDFMLGLQRSVNASDAAAIATAFAPELLDASPTGARTRANDAEFQADIEARLALLREAGARDVKALRIDPTPLSADYALVRVRWSIWFTPEGRTDFVDEFLVDYLIHLTGDGMEIAASIAHDSEPELRRRFGLSHSSDTPND